jgi:hypothetical protein
VCCRIASGNRQEIVMSTRKPTLLRWTEQAEAKHVCALATLEREPQSAAARPVAFAPPRPVGIRRRPPLLPRLRGWLGGAGRK